MLRSNLPTNVSQYFLFCLARPFNFLRNPAASNLKEIREHSNKQESVKLGPSQGPLFQISVPIANVSERLFYRVISLGKPQSHEASSGGKDGASADDLPQ